MRPPRIASTAGLALATLLVTACGSDDGSSNGHGTGHHGEHDPASGSSADELDDGLALPSDDTWAAAGFSCESFDAASYDDQTIQSCITADSQVATMVRMAVKDNQVVGWSYTGLPTVFPVDVSAAHQSTVSVVFGILNPDDAALAPSIAAGKSAASDTWEYESEAKPLPDGGYSSYEITASSALLEQAGQSTDLLPKPDSFAVDVDELQSAATGGELDCTIDDGLNTHLQCDGGDFTASITTDPEAGDHVRGLSFTSFAGADQYAAQAAEFVEFLKLADVPKLSALADELAATWTTGGPSWTWISGLPVLVTPMDSPWTFSVDATLVPSL